MTRIEIINRELMDLKNKQPSAVGAVLRSINKRINSIENVLLREMNYPPSSDNSISSASLNSKLDKTDVLDLNWLSEHAQTAEQLDGKVFDATVVKGLVDENSNAIRQKMDASVIDGLLENIRMALKEKIDSSVAHNLLDEVLGKIQELQAHQAQNYDPSQFTVLSSGKVGINTTAPVENLHLKWGHFLIEGGDFKMKNSKDLTLSLANFDYANIFNVANNLLKLDPTWGTTAVKIDGGLVSSNVPIFINNSANHFIVTTPNGNCRKIVVADDGTISTVVVPHP